MVNIFLIFFFFNFSEILERVSGYVPPEKYQIQQNKNKNNDDSRSTTSSSRSDNGSSSANQTAAEKISRDKNSNTDTTVEPGGFLLGKFFVIKLIYFVAY